MDKLEQIERKRQKTQEKAERIQALLKELDGELTEQENLRIVQQIRALKMTREELNAVIKNGVFPPSLQEVQAVPAARYARKTSKPEPLDSGEESGIQNSEREEKQDEE